MIKSRQSELLQYLIAQEEYDERSYKERCFIHLQDNSYVATTEYKDQIYIHIRNYQRRGLDDLIPTKQGVALTLSRWLLLEKKRRKLTSCSPKYQKIHMMTTSM